MVVEVLSAMVGLIGARVIAKAVDAALSVPPTLPTIAALTLVVWRFRPRPAPRRPGLRHARPDVGIESPAVPPPPPPPPGRVGNSDWPVSAPALPPVESKGTTVSSRSITTVLPTTSSRRSPRRWRRVRRVGPDLAALWCDAIAREIRAGASLAHAIDTADRPGPVDRAIRSGLAERTQPNEAVWSSTTSLTQRLSALVTAEALSAHLRLVVSVLATVARLGGPAAEPIDRAGVILRARAAADAERANQSAQAQMSALVMTLLPVAMLAVLTATSPSVRTVIATPFGAGVVGLGVTLNMIGWWWMHRIISGGIR